MTYSADRDIATQTDRNPDAPSAATHRVRLARPLGILLVAASLFLPLSGAMAFDAAAPVTVPDDVALARVAEDRSAPIAPAVIVPDAPEVAQLPTTAETASDIAGGRATIDHPGFTTGQRLDADQQAAFLAWVQAQQASGGHRGIAVWSSW